MNDRVRAIVIGLLCILSITGCSKNTSDKHTPGNSTAINLTSTIGNPNTIGDLNAFAIEQIFPEMHWLVAATRFNNGFVVYSSINKTPEEMRFYYCDINNGSMTELDYSIPGGLDVQDIRMTIDGQLLVIESVRGDASSNTYDSYRIHKLEKDSINLLVQGPPSALINLVVDNNNGRLYTHILNAEGDSIVIYSFEGALLREIDTNSIIHDIVYSEKDEKLFLSMNTNNTLQIYYLDESNYSLQMISQIDDVPHNTPLYHSCSYSFFVEIDFILYGYSLDKNSIEPIISWRKNGISDYISALMSYDDYFIVITHDIISYDLRILKLSVTTEPLSEKITLYLARFAEGRNFRLEGTIAKFNRENPQYFIEVKDYSLYGDEALSRMNLDVISGNAPDILELTGYSWDKMFLPTRQYISQGLLVDLAPYIDRDLTETDYIESAFRALYTGDMCYFIMPAFSIQSISGAPSAIEMIENSTLPEMLRLISEDTTQSQKMFATTMSQSEFLEYMLFSNMEHFINPETNVANFDSDEFVDLLEAAKSITHINGGFTDELAMLYFGDALVRFTKVSYIGDLDLDLHALRGDLRVTGTGFPATRGQGTSAMMIPNSMYAMSAYTTHKDGAWEFLKLLYSKELGLSGLDGFSMNRELFEQFIDMFNESIYEFEQYDDPGYIFSYYDAYSDLKDFFIPRLSTAEALGVYPHLQSLINSVDRLYLADSNILNIVNEEVEPFFMSDRSAEDTAGAIQSRIQLYLFEFA